MKKVKLFILDLIGITFAIIAVITGIFVLRGVAIQDLANHSVSEILNSGDGIIIDHLTIAGITIGSIAIIAGIFLIVMSFKDKSNLSLSIFIWILALSALGMVLYGLIKFSDATFVKSITDNLI